MRLPDGSYSVLSDHLIRGEQYKAMGERLTHKHAVKGVLVVFRQSRLTVTVSDSYLFYRLNPK